VSSILIVLLNTNCIWSLTLNVYSVATIVTYQVIFHPKFNCPWQYFITSWWQENVGFWLIDELIHHPWQFLQTNSSKVSSKRSSWIFQTTWTDLCLVERPHKYVGNHRSKISHMFIKSSNHFYLLLEHKRRLATWLVFPSSKESLHAFW